MSIWELGNKATLKRTFNESDVIEFAKLSTDNNPIHLDHEYAKTSIFKQVIVHGSLVASLFSAILANKLPGVGTIYLSQSLNYKAPCFLGDIVEASVEIINIRSDKPIYTLRTICVNSHGDLLIEGEAVVLYKP